MGYKIGYRSYAERSGITLMVKDEGDMTINHVLARCGNGTRIIKSMMLTNDISNMDFELLRLDKHLVMDIVKYIYL